MGEGVAALWRVVSEWALGNLDTGAAIATVLTFVGGGIAWFWPSKKPPPTTAVTATNGVAIGGNVTNSAVINIVGIEKLTPEQIAALIPGSRGDDAETRKLIADLSRQTGVTESALSAFFHTLGEKEVPPERLSVTLVDIARQYVEFRDRLATLSTNGEAERRQLADARVAIDKGDFDRAETLLRGLEEAQAEETNQARRNQAGTRAERARLSALRLDRLAAAEHYRVAAETLPNEDVVVRARYLIDSADALTTHGDERGDNDALRSAIDRYRHALTLVSRERDRDVWALVQNNMGNAFRTLGERERGTEHLEKAVSAYENTLQEWKRDRVPLMWAAVQNNLGGALSKLGERESGTGRLEKSVSAYRRALEERTREHVPLDWAMTQNNLGAALAMLWEREGRVERLEEAVSAYRRALEERTRKLVPLDWAMTQNNLGTALSRLGEREIGTDRLEEAVSAYRCALEERTRERVPLDWAMTQNNLGNTLLKLGERENGTENIEKAVSAYLGALLEWTRERGPLQWAMTQGNLSLALSVLADRTRDVSKAQAALAAIDNALAVFIEAKAEYHIGNCSPIRDRAVAVLERLQGERPAAD